MKPIAALVAALAGTFTAGAALADEPFGSDVWLASPQLCGEAKTAGSLQKTLDDGNLVLSAKGLRGADFHCSFVQVLKAPDADAWVATALCRQDTAGDFPNMYSISKGKDGRLTLVTVYDDEEQAADSNAGDSGDGSADGAAPQSDAATPPAGEPSDASQSPAGATQTPDAQGSTANPDAAGDEGAASEDVTVGDVYSRCEGIAAP